MNNLSRLRNVRTANKVLAGQVVSRNASKAAGLVGMPNVGKSTLFNALMRAQVSAASNYPFCTIEPSKSEVPVPDPKLDVLGNISETLRRISWTIEVHDIAGLIEGASKGEGLGNAFLNDIRATNAIVQVVRCFENPDIIHVMEHPDPIRDIQIIETELVLADAQSVEKRLANSKRLTTDEAKTQYELMKKIMPVLESGFPARVLEPSLNPADLQAWKRLQLLTQKPVVYACNVDENDASVGRNDMTDSVKQFLIQRHAEYADFGGVSVTPEQLEKEANEALVVLSANLEAEAALLSDEERKEFLEVYGFPGGTSALDTLIASIAKMLRFQVYYTTGKQETRAWCIDVGSTAQEAAAAIHTDIAKGFIKAEIISFDDFVKHGGEQGAKSAGVLRSEGKDYIMQEGDVCHFRFNASKK